ncbi:hypothetical protein L596_025022 [Steinernema carpocapsae]|uniref:Uncharacterized protein n=1 Tax=Steinernema carpocapsae TaxID=34508 RepID=A0A4U5M7E5_STECR|nr:hypothetical protein L596_025022 [Steinernema carpocapsae]
MSDEKRPTLLTAAVSLSGRTTISRQSIASLVYILRCKHSQSPYFDLQFNHNKFIGKPKNEKSLTGRERELPTLYLCRYSVR